MSSLRAIVDDAMDATLREIRPELFEDPEAQMEDALYRARVQLARISVIADFISAHVDADDDKLAAAAAMLNAEVEGARNHQAAAAKNIQRMRDNP